MSIFSTIPIPKVHHTPFNLSHGCRLSGNFGRLYPVNCRKIAPSSRLVFQNQSFSQFATMASKVYQEFTVKMERFFVPTRLIWANFKKFYSSDESEQYVHPYFRYDLICIQGLARHGSLFDYFNLPTFWYPDNFSINDYPWSDYDWSGHLDDLTRLRSIYQQAGDPVYHLDCFKFFAFVMVYSQYYADENLQSDLADWQSMFDSIQIQFDNHPDCTNDVIGIAESWDKGHYNRNYPKDYFTGALPFAQKGPRVNVPFTGQGYTQFYTNNEFYDTAFSPEVTARTAGVSTGVSIDADHKAVGFTLRSTTSSTKTYALEVGRGAEGTIDNRVIMQNGITSIDDLRTAIMLQEFYEKQARSGTRFKETLLAHFNVYNHDARLQRAQFLQGITTKMTIGNVYSTSANSDDTGITGEPVSVVNGAGLSRKRKFRATEPGYLINLVSVYPKASYYKGIPKEWMELDKFDYLWPDFQHLGEQEIKIAELSLGNSVNDSQQKDNDTFGYVPRYSQYRFALDEIHGDFRDSRKSMTSARDFAQGIALSKEFININPETNNLNRVFMYTENDVDHFDMDINEILLASLPLSYYGVPRFVV